VKIENDQVARGYQRHERRRAWDSLQACLLRNLSHSEISAPLDARLPRDVSVAGPYN